MSVTDDALALLTLGSLLLLALATDFVGRRTFLPRVTLLLVVSFAAGPHALGLLPESSLEWFPLVANMALAMIGFLVGGSLTRAMLVARGRSVVVISVTAGAVTAGVVATGLWLIGTPLDLALVLGAIATATDVAATVDVVIESKDRSPFGRALLGIVAVDDAWGLIAFALALSLAGMWNSAGDPAAHLLDGAWHIGGAMAVGAAIGVPMAYLTGRIAPGEPSLTEGLALVLLCGGLALWLEVSLILSAMTMGAVVANLARHHRRPFHAIEGIEWPFLALFFALAGASLDARDLGTVGAIGAAYVGLRIAGRLLGGALGARFAGESLRYGRWIGAALLPQAGVAVGVALVASQRLPELADRLLPIAIGATILFEIVGPVLTRRAVRAMGSGFRSADPVASGKQ